MARFGGAEAAILHRQRAYADAIACLMQHDRHVLLLSESAVQHLGFSCVKVERKLLHLIAL